MKNWKISLAVLGVVLAATPAWAQSTAALSQEIDELREDLKILQRQMYRGQMSDDVLADSGSVQQRLSQMEETVRQISGRMDEIDYKFKQIDERFDTLNRDFDVRFKMLEGKPISGSGVGTNVSTKQYDAPVAANPAKSVTGDAVEGPCHQGVDRSAGKVESIVGVQPADGLPYGGHRGHGLGITDWAEQIQVHIHQAGAAQNGLQNGNEHQLHHRGQVAHHKIGDELGNPGVCFPAADHRLPGPLLTGTTHGHCLPLSMGFLSVPTPAGFPPRPAQDRSRPAAQWPALLRSRCRCWR